MALTTSEMFSDFKGKFLLHTSSKPEDIGGAEYKRFRRLVDKVPGEAVLKDKGVQEGWTPFKRKIFKA